MQKKTKIPIIYLHTSDLIEHTCASMQLTRLKLRDIPFTAMLSGVRTYRVQMPSFLNQNHKWKIPEITERRSLLLFIIEALLSNVCLLVVKVDDLLNMLLVYS